MQLSNGEKCTLLSSESDKFAKCDERVVMASPGSKHKGRIILKGWHLMKLVVVSLGEEECLVLPWSVKLATVVKLQDVINTSTFWLDAQILWIH